MSYQLQGKADEWWTTWKGGHSIDAPLVSWEEFRQTFMECFIPRSMRITRAREFEHIKQGSMTVDEYDTKFIQLSWYAPYLVPEEREKTRRFIMGLRRP